jgi:dynactin 4
MLVSYTYRSDDPAPSEGDGQKTTKPPEVKTFSFYTVVDLGAITPKEELKVDVDS